MTVGVAIRVPGQGAVLACDSRTTGDFGTVYSDSDQKYGVFGTCVGLCAGQMGGLWIDLCESPPRNWAELRGKITDLDATAHGRAYEILVYDRLGDRILLTDHQGDSILQSGFAAIGVGADLALGVLSASKTPTTLDAAAKLVQRTVKIVCRRNALCGGRIRTLVVHGRKGPIDVR